MLETDPKLEATISVLAIVPLVPNPKGIFTLQGNLRPSCIQLLNLLCMNQ